MATVVTRVMRLSLDEKVRLALMAASAISVVLSVILGSSSGSIPLGFEIPSGAPL